MRAFVLAAVLLVSCPAWAQSQFGSVRASSQLEQGSKPALFHALNLFDGKESTAWCEGAEGTGVGQRVIIAFKAPVRVDQVRIINGLARTPATFRSYNRVRRLVIREEDSTRTLTLVDERESKVIRIEPALVSDRFEVEILDVFPGSGGADAACISELALMAAGEPVIDGPRAFEKGRAALMGTWYSGPVGARDRFLDFHVDGSFRFQFRPFDPEEQPTELVGEYTFDGDRLQLRTDGETWIDAKARRHADLTEDGRFVDVLEIGAAEFASTLARPWADAR